MFSCRLSMQVSEFIKNNPFPVNGEQINDRLVKDIQDFSKARFKNQNLYKLFKNNARLIYVIYKQFNYNQSLDSIMSFVYEGIKKATEGYNPEIGMPFYHYAVQTIRGILQNYYNYNNDLIHIPVMKKKKVKRSEFSDINDFLEHQYLSINTEKNTLSDEMDMIIAEYESQELSEDDREDLVLLKKYRVSNLKELSNKTKINQVRLRKIIERTTSKLKAFRGQLNQKLSKHGC